MGPFPAQSRAADTVIICDEGVDCTLSIDRVMGSPQDTSTWSVELPDDNPPVTREVDPPDEAATTTSTRGYVVDLNVSHRGQNRFRKYLVHWYEYLAS